MYNSLGHLFQFSSFYEIPKEECFDAVVSEWSYSPIAADPSLCEVDSSTLATQVSNNAGIILHNISRVSAAELC